MPAVILLLAAPAAADHAAATASERVVFVERERLQLVRARLQADDCPPWLREAYDKLMTRAEAALDREPQPPQRWHVPGFYRDADGHRRAKGVLQDDANDAYSLALAAHLTGDDRHATAAVRLIDAWSGGVGEMSTADDSTLSFSYHFPAMIFAADLVRDSDGWPRERQARFEVFLRDKALPMNTSGRANNWGNWGLVLKLSVAAYLGDDGLMERGAVRWREFIDSQIAGDGHLPHEVERNRGAGERGIWYSHFTLMPQTLAAEILRVNGIDLYDHESDGRSLRLAYEALAPWALDPDTFPWFKPDRAERQLGTTYVGYFELLAPRWPDPAAAELLRRHRPVRVNHCAPHLTLTHGVDLADGDR